MSDDAESRFTLADDVERGGPRIDGASQTRISRTPLRRGKWNGLELFAHIADADVVYYQRLLEIIAEEGVPIVPYDGERWIRELRASERPIEVSLAASRGARVGFVHHLQSSPIECLARRTLHPEEGVLSALDVAAWIGQHALHHLEQLEAIRDGKTWIRRR
jgi:hypothetical protein